MNKLYCQLIVFANTPHLQQIYTGLFLLNKKGYIKLSQIIENTDLLNENIEEHLKDTKKYHCRLIINNKIKVYYDLHDSWEIDKKELKECHIYFKRSYDENALEIYGKLKEKIKPLGINFWALHEHFDLFAIKRNIFLKNEVKDKIYSSLVSLKIFDTKLQITRIPYLETIPDIFQEPKIFFITRTWNPNPKYKLSEKKEKERKALNDKRAECISLLRKEFGDRFIGGFSHNEYTREHYRDLLLPKEMTYITKRRNYMETIEACPIGISTEGWHSCIPWRIGEYLIKGRAIVTEKISHKVPGDFVENINYLAYQTPEECLQCTKELFYNDLKRQNMMLENSKYYFEYVKAEKLVLNSLITALKVFSKQ